MFRLYRKYANIFWTVIIFIAAVSNYVLYFFRDHWIFNLIVALFATATFIYSLVIYNTVGWVKE